MRKSSLHGELSISAIYKDGRKCVFDTANTITLEASRVASHVLVGDDISNLKISKMGFGTNATPPSRTNTNLGNLIFQQDIDSTAIVNVGQIEFVTVLDFISPANGFILSEAGLYTANGLSLFARQVHVAQQKNDEFKLEYVWRIVFT